ncbi:MAG: hypothetical protein QOG43_1735 [Actinomycetota bacterium]|nr:hypothetical protein [Actinomycetota bacterium]
MLFADAGLSDARISTLLLLWTAVGIVAEVPAGALADRFSRRAALAVGSLFQAAAYGLWTAAPGYSAFAAGFVLWGLGGAFASGALEALVYDGLAVVGAEAHYPRISSRVTAVGLLCQLPTAAAATLLFATGGYAVVGWVSVGCCLAGALVAARLPERRPPPAPSTDTDAGGADAGTADDPGYLALLRQGLREAARNPAVRVAVVAVAALGGLDGIDEYFPLLARDWGIAASAVPLAIVGIPLAGAAGAALGGPASRLRPRTLALVMALAVGLFCGAALLHRPVGVAGVAVAYGLYQLVLVVANVRLQARIEGPSRATVTSVASLGTELSAAVLVGAWAADRPWLVTVVAVAVAAALPRLLRSDVAGAEPVPRGSAGGIAGGVARAEGGPR